VVLSLDYEVLSRDSEGKSGNVYPPFDKFNKIVVEGDLNSLNLMLQKQVLELVCLIGMVFCGVLTCR
jgi:hypothetical protein